MNRKSLAFTIGLLSIIFMIAISIVWLVYDNKIRESRVHYENKIREMEKQINSAETYLK